MDGALVGGGQLRAAWPWGRNRGPVGHHGSKQPRGARTQAAGSHGDGNQPSISSPRSERPHDGLSMFVHVHN
jgi:hypothetical protein